MPELPDVETFKHYVEETSLNQTIQEIETTNSKLYKSNASEVRDKLKGKQFQFHSDKPF